MEAILNSKQMKELFEAIVASETTDECKKIVRDPCALAELKTVVECWQVAQQINQNIPYRVIAKKTGCSTATTTRVAHWLLHGSGGYRLMLHRL